ncbi:MAG: RNA polymerase sigma factor [Bacteroidales bacterium]
MKNQPLPSVLNSNLTIHQPIILTEMHRQKVFAYLYSFLKDKDLCNDLTQDTLLCAYTKSLEHVYEERGLLICWLKKIALFKAHDHFRNISRKIRLHELHATELAMGLVEDKEFVQIPLNYGIQPIATKEEKIDYLLHLISDKQRIAIRLHYFENYTMEEIAQQLKTNKNTVTGRCRLGLKNLRELAAQRGFSLEDILDFI